MVGTAVNRAFLPAKSVFEQVGELVLLTGRTIASAVRPPYPYGTEFVNEPGVDNETVQDFCPLDPVGHVGLAFDPDVAQLVRDALDPAQPVPLADRPQAIVLHLQFPRTPGLERQREQLNCLDSVSLF